MANYPQELAQDAVCQSHTGHMTGLWFLPARPLRLNTNEWKVEQKLNFRQPTQLSSVVLISNVEKGLEECLEVVPKSEPYEEDI